MDQAIIKFSQTAHGMIPLFTTGHMTDVRRISVENVDEFQSQLEDGASFAVEIVEIVGRGASKQAKVRIARRIAEGSGACFDEFYVEPAMRSAMLLDLSLGHHLLFRGPTGVGKTTLAKLLAKHLGVGHVKVDCTGIYKPKDLVGSDSATGGTLTFVPNDLVRFLDGLRDATGCPTGIVTLDELTRIRGNGEGLHPLLDESRRLAVTTSEGTRVVEFPRGVVAIATANPSGGGYVGTSRIDAAMLDRFEPYDLGYPPADFEVNMLVTRAKVSEIEAGQIVRAANALREKVALGSFPSGGAPSPRRMLRAAEFVANGVSVVDAVYRKLANHYEGDAASASTERGIAYGTLRASGFDAKEASPRITSNPSEATCK